MNTFAIAGRMARDPEVNGSVVKFTVAVDDYNSTTKERGAQFLPCVAFGKLGEIVQKFGGRGREVAVRGKMRENKWEDRDGNKRSRWEFIAEDVDLMGGKTGGNAAPAPKASHRDTGDDGGFSLGDD